MKTLVKTKIVKVNNGSLCIFYWEKWFSFFGRWVALGGSTYGDDKIPDETLKKITNDNVTEVLFDNFISLDKK